MKLPSLFTAQTNEEISKTIKNLLVLEDSKPNVLIENHGFGFIDLARSLNSIRPTGKMTFGQLKDKKALIQSAKRFVKIYS